MDVNEKTVLVVDDDPCHLVAARKLLEMEGYRVVVHDSPFGTTEKISTVRPDVVLIDVNMPALSGDRLCFIVRGRSFGREVPILLYSSNDEDSLRAAALRYGADGYICKGDLAALRRRVAEMAWGRPEAG